MGDGAWPPNGGLVRATDVVGLPVVSIDDGEDLAHVHDVIYDPSRRLLIGFTLRKGGGLFGRRMSSVLDAGNITAIGPDAVMVANGEALIDPVEAPTELAERDATLQVLDTPAVTTQGHRLGVVTGVILDTSGRPSAVGYEIRESADGGHHGPSRFVPISDQMALSADALVVPVELLDFAGDDLDGFGRVLDSYRAADRSGRSGAGRVNAEVPGAAGGPPSEEQQ